jgi:hypothetical protein
MTNSIIHPQQLHSANHHSPIITQLDYPNVTPPPPPNTTTSHPCHDLARSLVDPDHHYLVSLLSKTKYKRIILDNYNKIAAPEHWKQVFIKVDKVSKNNRLQPQQRMDKIVKIIYKSMYQLLSTIIPKVPKRGRKKEITGLIKSLSNQQRIFEKLVKMSNNPRKYLSSHLNTNKFNNLAIKFHNIITHNYQRLCHDHTCHIISTRTKLSQQLFQQKKFKEAENVTRALNNLINNAQDETITTFNHICDENHIMATTEQQTIDNFHAHAVAFQHNQLQQFQERQNDPQYHHYKSHFSRSAFSSTITPNNKPPIDHSMLMDDFTQDELLKAIDSMRLFKSDGSTPFPQELLKCVSMRHRELKRTTRHKTNNDTDYFDPLLTIFTTLMNMINQYKIQPTIFNYIYITFIPKTANNTHLFSNYRPISIINNIMKLHNKMITHRLISYLTKQSLIAWEQIGFLPKQNRFHHMLSLAHIYTAEITHEQLDDITTTHTSTIPTDPNLPPTTIDTTSQIERHIALLDFSKAFDTIHIDTLFDILEDEFNIPSNSAFAQLLRSIFNNTKYYVKGPTTVSPLINHIIGTMQGLPISPILFLCYINSLFLTLRDFDDGFPWTFNNTNKTLIKLNSLGFADDSTLISITRFALRRKMIEAFKWCYFRNMAINPTKCVIQSIYSDDISDLTFDHPFQPNTPITIKYQPKTSYLGAKFSAPLYISTMIKDAIKPFKTRYHNNDQLLRHHLVPIATKRQIIQNFISTTLNNAPMYALLFGFEQWDEMIGRIKELIDQRVIHAWSSLTERQDFSTSLQVKYDALNIPIPSSLILTSFFNIIHAVFIDVKKPHHHESPFATYIQSISNQTHNQHLFNQPATTDGSKPHCRLSSVIDDFYNNFRCNYIQDPDIIRVNNLQYQLQQLKHHENIAIPGNDVRSVYVTVNPRAVGKESYERKLKGKTYQFPISNPSQDLHKFNPCSYKEITNDGTVNYNYSPTFDFTSQLPSWFTAIIKSYNNTDALSYQLLPHDQNPTTTPFPINNRSLKPNLFKPTTTTGVISNVLYNQHIVNNYMKGTIGQPIARSLVEQFVFNYCALDKFIAQITSRLQLDPTITFNITQLRTTTFYTKTELLNRGHNHSKSMLPYTVPTTQLDQTSYSARHDILHYYPTNPNDDDQRDERYTFCQFNTCPHYRSTQHYLLQCQDSAITSARKTTFEQLQHLIRTDINYNSLIISDITTHNDNLIQQQTKLQQLINATRTTLSLDSFIGDIPKWINSIARSPINVYQVIIDIQSLFGFDYNLTILHNRSIPEWSSPRSILSSTYGWRDPLGLIRYTNEHYSPYAESRKGYATPQNPLYLIRHPTV